MVVQCAEARAAMNFFDHCEVEGEFLDKACVMKSPPAFLKGACRSAMFFPLDEGDIAVPRSESTLQFYAMALRIGAKHCVLCSVNWGRQKVFWRFTTPLNFA